MAQVRFNSALWGQVLVGLGAVASVLSASLNPRSSTSALLAGAMVWLVWTALAALSFELLLIPFGRSALLRPLPRRWAPLALFGVIATTSVVSGVVERALRGEVEVASYLAPPPLTAFAVIVLVVTGRRWGLPTSA